MVPGTFPRKKELILIIGFQYGDGSYCNFAACLFLSKFPGGFPYAARIVKLQLPRIFYFVKFFHEHEAHSSGSKCGVLFKV